MERTLEAFWSEEDFGYIAIDRSRPGCSAFGTTLEEAEKELRDAQIAWDAAQAAAGNRS